VYFKNSTKTNNYNYIVWTLRLHDILCFDLSKYGEAELQLHDKVLKMDMTDKSKDDGANQIKSIKFVQIYL